MERQLDEGRFLTLVVKGTTVVVAQGGRFWLTHPGDPDDHLLVDGEALALPRGRWLVQALVGGVFRWTDDLPVPQRIVFRRSADETCRLPAFSRI